MAIKTEKYIVSLKSNINVRTIREDIEEFIISSNKFETNKCVKSTIDNINYYYCIKYMFNDDDSYETIRLNIDEDEYNNYLSNSSRNIQKAIRYHFIYDGEQFRLTFYLIDNEQVIYLERDVVNEKKEELPSFIANATKITNNKEKVFK